MSSWPRRAIPPGQALAPLPQHLLLLLNVTQRIQLGLRGLGFRISTALSPRRGKQTCGTPRSRPPGLPRGRACARTPGCPPRPPSPSQRPGGGAGCSPDLSDPEPARSPLIGVGVLEGPRCRRPCFPLQSPLWKRAFITHLKRELWFEIGSRWARLHLGTYAVGRRWLIWKHVLSGVVAN